MATPLTQFQKKRLERRKSSDIGNLLKQYQQQVGAITGEYETSFADYSKKRAETMAPYETATEQYRKEFASYQENAAAYKEKLTDYQAKLAYANQTPTEEVAKDKYTKSSLIRYGTTINIDGKSYYAGDGMNKNSELPEGYVYEGGKLYKSTMPAKFEEKAPTAPTAPVAPTIEEFDTKPFEEKKAAVETTFKREIGERKAAKFGSVSRKGTRTLLSGATPNA
jgi:hypothetical protein